MPLDPRPADRPLRVLAVDDHPDVVLTLAALLRKAGHGVAAWSDGPAALAAAAGFRPDAAVIDIGLPGLDGWELARRLREACGPGLALVVAVTGYGDADSRRRSAEAGIDHHLTTPADPGGVLRPLASVRDRLAAPA